MFNSFLFAVAVFLGWTAATPVAKKNAYISVPFTRTITNGTSNLLSRSINKRAYYNENLVDTKIIYQASCSLGTPPQSQTLTLDTGSAEIWVYGPDLHDSLASYDVTASSTSEYVDSDLELYYTDGHGYTGYHYKDSFGFSGVTITGQEFGYVNDTSAKTGYAIWGLSPFLSNYPYSYTDVPSNLKSQGYINKNAFSMSLDDTEGQTGTVLFGALDTSKYSGELWSLPISMTDRFAINSTGLSINGIKIDSFGTNRAMLDSGTTTTVIPDDALAELTKYVDVSYVSKYGLYYWNSEPTDGTIEYEFGNAKISVDLVNLYSTALHNSEGQILFSILPTSYYNLEGYTIFGDTFLRSAYVVYSYDDWQIAIAQASNDSSETNLVVFSDTEGIPESTPA